MSARSVPLPSGRYGIRIPEPIWSAALEEVRRYGELSVADRRRGSEGLVFLGGVASPTCVVVTTLYIISHEPQGDRVEPTRDEMRWVLTTLRARDEKLIAQLHSHRFGAQHSVGDDRMATSFHEGFLSIVVPAFGRGVETIDECIVHEYSNGLFRALSQGEVAERVRIEPLTIRRECLSQSSGSSQWRRFVQKLKSIVPRTR